MKHFISVLLLVIVLQWVCISDLAAQNMPPTAETTFRVVNHSSLSPGFAYSQTPTNVQIFISGPLVDHYRITFNYVDPYGQVGRIVSYCDHGAYYDQIFQPTVCVIQIDAAVITSVYVQSFPASPLLAKEVTQ